MTEKNKFGDHTSQMFQLVLDSIPSRVFWKDKDLVYQGGNRQFMNDAGVDSTAQLIGKTDFDLAWTKEQANNFRGDDTLVMSNGESKVNFEEKQTHPDGELYWLQTSKIPLRDHNGDVIGMLGTYTDITERKQFEQKIHYQATHDDLTDLPNRRHLQQVMDTFFENEASKIAGLLFIDLDRFKLVNDSLGHAVGDKLLKQVAGRLRDHVRGGDLAARLGGDEFSFFVTSVTNDISEAKNELVSIALKIIDSLCLPFSVDEHLLYIGASIGCTVVCPGDKNTSDKLREADMALYLAKDQGRNTYAFYDKMMLQHANREHDIQNQLRQALNRNEFYLVYQPQYRRDGTVLGAEVLLRWNNKALGSISPVEFIPAAEHTGIIHTIGQWVIETAMTTVNELCTLLPDNFKLAINVSAIQFQREDFVTSLESALNKSSVEASYIELEITESLLLNNETSAQEKLHKLKDMGFTIAIDDFGTGYSSLSYLTHLPIDKLKIDQSFVRQMKEDDRQARIVETIINMTKSLNLDVIAEGVETEFEKQFLVSHNCHQFQGYLFSKPVSREEFESLLGGISAV